MTEGELVEAVGLATRHAKRRDLKLGLSEVYDIEWRLHQLGVTLLDPIYPPTLPTDIGARRA